MSKINKIAMRELVQGLSAFLDPTGVTSYVLGLLDRLENDQTLEEMQRQLARLEQAIGKDPTAIDGSLTSLLALPAPPDMMSELRRAQSCLVIMRALTESESAMEWVPQLEYDDAVALLEKQPDVGNAEKELRLVAHELLRTGLIKTDLGRADAWHVMGPTDDFFWKTDALFHPWNPEDDARELCRRAVATDDGSLPVHQVANDLGWPARRINPALAYMVAHGLAEHSDEFRNGPYLCRWIETTPEATFFIKA
jgi:hypothetical protein